MDQEQKKPSNREETPLKLQSVVNVLLIIAAVSALMGRITTIEDYAQIRLEQYRLAQTVEKKKALWRSEGFSEEQVVRKGAKYESAARESLKLRRPTLSANDRSRWATIRALVEPEMQVPGVPYAIDKVIQQRGWDTIDMVKHDGHLYSSKPPLLPTIQSYVYKLVVATTGKTCVDAPFETVRTVVTICHIPLFILFLWMVLLITRKLSRSEYVQTFVLGTACFGTYIPVFGTTLQNHLPGTAAIAVALYGIIRIVLDGQAADHSAESKNRVSIGLYMLCGLFGAFSVACELPALAFFASIAVVSLYINWKKTLLGFVPAAACVAAAFFAVNYQAHGTIIPAYAQRNAGENWYLYTYDRGDGVQRQSYWHNRVGIDRGEPSRLTYAYHVLIGHHGVFFLTPVWILSIAGAGIWLSRWRLEPKLALLALFVLAMTVIVLGFYIARPLDDRNYGGMTCAFRWAFWLIPLWLTSLIPFLEVAQTRPWLRRVAWLALAWSVLAANTALMNPWSHPWLYGVM